MPISVHQPGEEMGLEFVLAGLAGQDDHKGEAEIVEDGFFDGAGDLNLVGTQGNLTGAGPGDGGAADGGADLLGEGNHFSPRRTRRTQRRKEEKRNT